MGHESIATTNRYLHFLGTGADLAGLERLNSRPGAPGGTREGDERMTMREPRPVRRVSAGGTGFRWGGAEGIRTPDLLIANETRYQLRHSPLVRVNANTTPDGIPNRREPLHGCFRPSWGTTCGAATR